jgi:glucose-1-phosphatase
MALMQQFKAVVWDLGGVILRTEDPLPRVRLAERLGVTRDDLERRVFTSEAARLAEVGKIPEEEVWEYLRSYFRLEPTDMAEVVEQFWGGDRFDADLINYIESLKAGYKIGLLSNAWSGARESVSKRFKFLHIFDEVIFSAEVKLAKPDANIYTLMVNRLGVNPQQAIFIDDIQGNVNGAEAIGMRGIRFENPEQIQNELRKLL